MNIKEIKFLMERIESKRRLTETEYRQKRGDLLKEEEKSLPIWKNQLEDRFKKNNYNGKFTQNSSECSNFEKIVKEKLDQKLVVVCLGDGGHIFVTVNKNNLEEMFKIVDSIKSFLPDGYGEINKTSGATLQILKEK